MHALFVFSVFLGFNISRFGASSRKFISPFHVKLQLEFHFLLYGPHSKLGIDKGVKIPIIMSIISQ